MPHPMSDRTGLGKLFFELSNPRRLAILSLLRQGPLRLSKIAVQCRLTAPETSRHLVRMTQQGLLQRSPEGGYSLTGFGHLVAREMSSFEVLLARKAFLRNHDLTVMPEEFLRRLYVFEGAEEGSNVSNTLRVVEQVLEEARDHAWFLSDQAMLTSTVLLNTTRRTRASVRLLVPSSILPPSNQRVNPIPRELPLELRVLPEVRLALAMNEKIAGVCFAAESGPVDYTTGFRSESVGFLRWSHEVFEHYWKQGRVIRTW